MIDRRLIMTARNIGEVQRSTPKAPAGGGSAPSGSSKATLGDLLKGKLEDLTKK